MDSSPRYRLLYRPMEESNQAFTPLQQNSDGHSAQLATFNNFRRRTKSMIVAEIRAGTDELELAAMDHAERIQLAPGVNYQSLGKGEDGVLLCMQSGYLFRCNATAIAILDALREMPTRDEVLERFAKHCRMPLERVRGDLVRFIDELQAQHLIVKAA